MKALNENLESVLWTGVGGFIGGIVVAIGLYSNLSQYEPYKVKIEDINADSLQDVVIMNKRGNLYGFIQQKNGTYISFGDFLVGQEKDKEFINNKINSSFGTEEDIWRDVHGVKQNGK